MQNAFEYCSLLDIVEEKVLRCHRRLLEEDGYGSTIIHDSVHHNPDQVELHIGSHD